jgi:hypothetical protein
MTTEEYEPQIKDPWQAGMSALSIFFFLENDRNQY